MSHPSSAMRIIAVVGMVLVFRASSAVGGVISFTVGATDQLLTITNTGDSTAYSPSAFMLRSDGRWLPLSAKRPAFQWRPQEQLRFVRPPPNGAGQDLLIAPLPILLCFFDQSGVEFDQVAFLDSPRRLDGKVDSQYIGDKLYVHFPEEKWHIAATWVLRSGRGRINTITEPLRLQHVPPRPTYIRWASVGTTPQIIDTDPGFPATYLVHQVNTGRQPAFLLQTLLDSRYGGGQRVWWLVQGPVLLGIGVGLSLAGVTLLLVPAVRAVIRQCY